MLGLSGELRGVGGTLFQRHDPATLLADQDLATGQGSVAELNEVEHPLAPYVARAEPRQRALTSVRGLRRAAERKHSWPRVKVSGALRPSGVQPLLGGADRGLAAIVGSPASRPSCRRCWSRSPSGGMGSSGRATRSWQRSPRRVGPALAR